MLCAQIVVPVQLENIVVVRMRVCLRVAEQMALKIVLIVPTILSKCQTVRSMLCVHHAWHAQRDPTAHPVQQAVRRAHLAL